MVSNIEIGSGDIKRIEAFETWLCEGERVIERKRETDREGGGREGGVGWRKRGGEGRRESERERE